MAGHWCNDSPGSALVLGLRFRRQMLHRRVCPTPPTGERDNQTTWQPPCKVCLSRNQGMNQPGLPSSFPDGCFTRDATMGVMGGLVLSFATFFFPPENVSYRPAGTGTPWLNLTYLHQGCPSPFCRRELPQLQSKPCPLPRRHSSMQANPNPHRAVPSGQLSPQPRQCTGDGHAED
jgi:hypothetical protein